MKGGLFISKSEYDKLPDRLRKMGIQQKTGRPYYMKLGTTRQGDPRLMSKHRASVAKRRGKRMNYREKQARVLQDGRYPSSFGYKGLSSAAMKVELKNAGIRNYSKLNHNQLVDLLIASGVADQLMPAMEQHKLMLYYSK